MELFEYIDILNQPYDIFVTDIDDSPLHWHYYSEILFIHSGAIDVYCNNKCVTLSKGDLCYFYPLQLHSVSKNVENTEKVKYSVIKFNIQTLHIPKAYLQPIYDCFVHRTSEDDFCMVVHNESDTMESIANTIVNEYASKKYMHMFAVQSGIFSLLIQIARTIDLDKKNAPKQSEQNLSFYHILEYIDIHSGESIEIKDLVQRCNMSYSHFARLFRDNYGRSCKEYIQYIRMNKAQDLLLNSDFDLDYIAQETGFYDCSHFIRQYKKWRGITPKQERVKSRIQI